jgi:hypothetical protein
VDSTGQTIDFLLMARRDTAAAKRFLIKAMEASGSAMPRVMNADWNPAYVAAVEALKADRSLPRGVQLRQCKYLNNLIEPDHRNVKKRARLAAGYRSFQSAWRTLQGIETIHMIRKGRVRWLAAHDVAGEALFINFAMEALLHVLLQERRGDGEQGQLPTRYPAVSGGVLQHLQWPQFGTITGVVNSQRQVQFSLKLLF